MKDKDKDSDAMDSEDLFDENKLQPIVKAVICALESSHDRYRTAKSLSEDTGIPENKIKVLLDSDARIKKMYVSKLDEPVYSLKKENILEELWNEIRQMSYFKLGGGV